MATATRRAKKSKKTDKARVVSSKGPTSSGSPEGRSQVREQGMGTMIVNRDREYPEAPEFPGEALEQPEAKYEQTAEAPDAGESRWDPSEEYFTHGRSWS